MGELTTQLTVIVSDALSTPTRRYTDKQIAVKVDCQSLLDRNLKPLRIEVIVTGHPESVANRNDALWRIIDAIKIWFGDDYSPDLGSVWVMLPENTSFGEF
jgi:hypothetical protein